jgi:hypothetical protein
MKRLALVGFPDGLARQDIDPTLNFDDPLAAVDRFNLELSGCVYSLV